MTTTKMSRKVYVDLNGVNEVTKVSLLFWNHFQNRGQLGSFKLSSNEYLKSGMVPDQYAGVAYMMAKFAAFHLRRMTPGRSVGVDALDVPFEVFEKLALHVLRFWGRERTYFKIDVIKVVKKKKIGLTLKKKCKK